MTLSFERIAGNRAEGLFLHRALPKGGEQVLTARSGALTRSTGSPLLEVGLEEVVSFEDEARAARRRPLQLAFRRYQLSEPMRAAARRPRATTRKELISTSLSRSSGECRGLPAAAVAPSFTAARRSFSVLLLPLLALPLALS